MAARTSGKLGADIARYTCEPGQRKGFADGTNGLILFVDWRTPASEPRRVFVFDSKLRGRTRQHRIGEWPTWTLTAARRRARELRALLDMGTAPAEIVARQRAEEEANTARREAERATLLDAWRAYVEDRQSSPKPLGELSLRDLAKHIGDRDPKTGRRGAARKAGALQDWQDKALSSIDAEAVRTRHASLVRTRGAAQANQAMRLLRAVLNFAARDARFKGAMSHGNPVSILTERRQWADVAPRARVLERGQLREWWRAVQRLDSVTLRGYLRFLLFTGARRGEALGLRWEAVDFRWRAITFKDTKTGGDRVIPLTRFTETLLIELRDHAAATVRARRARAAKLGALYVPGPREGFVFDLVEPAKGVRQVAEATGVHLSSHDLRRSFATLSEWIEIPSGIIRQVMGHSPRGDVHEGHYRKRPLDLLALHMQRYEDWMIGEAGEAPLPAQDVQQQPAGAVVRLVG